MHYGTVVLALAFAIASCMWVQMTSLGSFAALLVSAILFFAVYGGVLVLRKEPLSCLADGREGTADAIQKKKNWVACHVSVMLPRPFVRASQEGMISSIGKTFVMKYPLQTNRPRISVQVVCDTQITSSLWWGCIFLLQFMGGSAILNSSGMVNDFKECTARILIWRKPGLLGLFAVYFLQLPEK